MDCSRYSNKPKHTGSGYCAGWSAQAAGVQAAGVQAAGVQTAGVQTAGVQTAGVQAAGVQAAGVQTAALSQLISLSPVTADTLTIGLRLCHRSVHLYLKLLLTKLTITLRIN